MSDFNHHRSNGSAAAGRARRAGWLASAISSLAAVVASAQSPLQTVEECIETGTDRVTLPGVAGGTLSASQCRDCQTLRLRFDARTRYFIDNESVPYARLREAAAKGRGNLYVFYRPDTRTLTRVRLESGADGNSK
jgi:hypothetical protein